MHDIEQTLKQYPGSSSDDEDEEFENNNRNGDSSEDDDDYENQQSRKKKLDHQLEWDDAAIEYGPKKIWKKN